MSNVIDLQQARRLRDLGTQLTKTHTPLHESLPSNEREEYVKRAQLRRTSLEKINQLMADLRQEKK